MLRRLLFVFIICMTGNMLWSQKNLTKAQRQFELKAFDLAIENSKKTLEFKPDCVECHYIIAESFRMMNENVDASIWYRKMEKLDNLPNDFYLNYGQLMKKMGQYDKAIECFETYKSHNEQLALHYIESCEMAKAILSEKVNFELNLYGGSSKSTDFAATIFKDKLVFSSFRNDVKRSLEINNNSIVEPKGPQFFIAGQSDVSTLTALNFLMHDNEESYDMGPIHYASKANICTITKNNFKDGEQQVFSDDLELTLYLAEVDFDGSYDKMYAYPYNEVGFATGFGTLNPSGTILYFASNRPGGYGGFDIYVSYYKNDQWSYPENLGPRINSTGNEVTPYFDGETLYFASDFHKGLGGLDVFKSSVYKGDWTGPVNMGNGVNSPEDDFYFVKHPEKESYYITSNRLGGKGSYDIYHVNKSDQTALVQEVAYEDVAPAEVNIDEDVLTNENTASFQQVSLTDTDATEEIIEETEVIEAVSPEEDVAEALTEKIDFNSLFPPKAVELEAEETAYISLAGAKRVSFGEVIFDHTNVYFIQLAALFKSSGNIDNFLALKQFGSLYKMKHTNAIKVKLGYFMDESQAKKILNEVKKMGYADAFITYESLNTGKLELVEVSESTSKNYGLNDFDSNETTGVNFKVRLASYEDPIWFDINSVKDLGVIEQWSKDKWTIFILSGFKDLEDAKRVKLIAQNRGFRDAEVVLDKNGILERFK